MCLVNSCYDQCNYDFNCEIIFRTHLDDNNYDYEVDFNRQ